KAVWDDGQMAIVHGCGYPDPDRSHFSSMEFWHTATPHQAQTTGWVGRFADARWPEAKPNAIVNIAVKESLAGQATKHSPVVFYGPEEFVRAGDKTQAAAYRELIDQSNTGNHTLDFLTEVCKSAADSSARVRDAVASYQTPVAYGYTPLALDLKK